MRLTSIEASLAFATALSASGCNELRGRLLANDGFREYRARDFVRAVELYGEARAVLPQEALLRRNLALSHLAASRTAATPAQLAMHLDQAITLLRESVEADPKDAELSELLVNAWIEAGRLAEAAEYFTARTRQGGPDEAWRMLAVVEAQRGNHPAAIAASFERARLHPQNAAVQAAIATLSWEWLHSGGPEGAAGIEVATRGLDAALEAERLDPQQHTALVYAGLLLRERAARQTDRRAAEGDLRRAEEISARVRARQSREGPPEKP